MKYIDSAKEIIAYFSNFCSPGEFVTFKYEADKFIDSLNDKPLSEQSRQFMDHYGHIYRIVVDDKKRKLIESINKKLRFFYVLAVIWVILVVIAFLYYWFNY